MPKRVSENQEGTPHKRRHLNAADNDDIVMDEPPDIFQGAVDSGTVIRQGI